MTTVPFGARATACLLLAACATPALASTSIHMRFGDALYNVDKQGEGPINANGERLFGDTRRASGFASVDHGVIKIAAKAEGSAGATVQGEFSDYFTLFDANIPNGTAGVASFTMAVTGDLFSQRQPNNTGTGQASFTLGVEVNNAGTGIHLEGIQRAGASYIGDALGTYTGSFRFRFGFENELEVEASCFAGSSSGFSGMGASGCRLDHTIVWGGITSIVPEDGYTLGNVSLTSGSGANYLTNLAPAAPVPEPATWASMALGLLGLGAAVRRRVA